MRSRPSSSLPISVDVCCACGAVIACILFKFQFAGADALSLDWLLKPTSMLVSACTGLAFHSLDAAGYYNPDQGILIAPACSGLNFFIILAATGGCLVQRNAGGLSGLFGRLGRFALAAGLAYCFAIAVNTARILIALVLYRHDLSLGLFSAERLHRVEGIVIYYVCLCLYAMLLSALIQRFGRPMPGSRTQPLFRTPGCLRIALPLACYLLFTLVLPFFNGAAVRDARIFAEHCLTVLVVSAAISWCLYRILGTGKRRPLPENP